MESLKFDEGYKEYMINDNPDRVIRINPSDLNMWQRCMDEMEKLGHVKDELQGNVKLLEDGTVDPTDENASAEWKKAEQGVKDCFNAIFNADVYDILFNGQSPFSPVKGGKICFLYTLVDLCGIFYGDPGRNLFYCAWNSAENGEG